ncbi:hypothetical protein KZX50_19895 [Bacillus infantis]|jgi:hypothetical protein|uniref:hypothetical protein n=1 Tax=Bacillus infantis TaxID=324767 RepID=UPI00200577A6|nr:hypothetical protein [Bacillus infantis]MCK6207708.1 hypothetical protein [Bacillus infantis]
MTNEQSEMNKLLEQLNEKEILIFKEILQTEKEFLHRKNLQGTSVISDIVEIVKERIAE